MCVIIVKPADRFVPHTHLRTANTNNPHGWGIASRAKNGTILIQRGFSTRSLIKAYEKRANQDMVIHCRIGTSGGNTLENTHPFTVADNTWMFHNGIFRDIALTTANRSDTWHLAQLLKPAFVENPALLSDESFLKQMRTYCKGGYPNKLVFMSATNTVIINDEAGVESNGCWYSNGTAFPSTRVQYRRIINAPALRGVTNHSTTHGYLPSNEDDVIRRINRRERRGTTDLRRLHDEFNSQMQMLGDQEDGAAFGEGTDDDQRAEMHEWTSREQRSWEEYIAKKYGTQPGHPIPITVAKG